MQSNEFLKTVIVCTLTYTERIIKENRRGLEPAVSLFFQLNKNNKISWPCFHLKLRFYILNFLQDRLG